MREHGAGARRRVIVALDSRDEGRCGKTGLHCTYDRDCCSGRCDASTMCE